MASNQTSLTSMTKERQKRSRYRRVQVLLWLMMALVMGAVTLLLWMAEASFALQSPSNSQSAIHNTMATAKFDAPLEISELNELSKEVEPITFDALVRDMRHYPDEFKDKQFLKKNSGKWTVQVMDVSEYDIVTDYLNSRDDRSKFSFFRYLDENDQPRYILLYDVFPSAQMAMGASKLIDFDLPENVRVIPEEIDRYNTVIENYELSEPMRSVNIERVRQVKLQPTRHEVPARPQVSPSETVIDATPEQNSQESSATENSHVNTPPPKQTIKGSVDDKDTLAVNEARRKTPVNEVPAATEPSQNSRAESNPPSNNAKVKPKQEGGGTSKANESVAENKPTSAPASSANSGNSGDSIRALIEEKSN